MLPSGMDGLERAALTEKSQGDASRRPGRRSFSAPAGGRGRGQQLASVNAERTDIVEIYCGCCCRSKLLRCAQDARLRVFGCVVQFSNGGRTPQNRGCGTHTSERWDYVKKRKKRWRHGIGLWLQEDFFHTEVHSAAEYFMYRGSLKAM